MICVICQKAEANVAVKQIGNDKLILPICYNDYLNNMDKVKPIKALSGVTLTVEDMMDP